MAYGGRAVVFWNLGWKITVVRRKPSDENEWYHEVPHGAAPAAKQKGLERTVAECAWVS